jgi:CheY-like chemotaxis protein
MPTPRSVSNMLATTRLITARAARRLLKVPTPRCPVPLMAGWTRHNPDPVSSHRIYQNAVKHYPGSPAPDQPVSREAEWHRSTPTVLVVEDEPAVREVVADLLQDEGYAVRQASDGLQAIDELQADNIDLVLSDVRMPRLDGPSLAPRLRGRGHAVPVVLMTAVDVEVDLPGVRFLPKPFDRVHLLHVIGSTLGSNR